MNTNFKTSIKNGTGEAIVLLKDNPSIDFDEYILEACTKNLAYDPQCEGSRAEYLFEILSLAKNKEKISNQILTELRLPSKPHWDVHLVFDIAEFLAKEGNENARKAIYERFANNCKEGFDNIETNTLISLDGLKGLEFTAETQGKLLDVDSEYWVDGYDIEFCEDCYPDSKPKEYLEKKASENRYIKMYLSEIEEVDSLSDKRREKNTKRSLSEMLKLIERGIKVPIFSGKWLSKKETEYLCQCLLKDVKEDVIEQYLNLLMRTKHPVEAITTLPLLESKNSIIKHRALRILSKIKHSKIRELIDKNYDNHEYLLDNISLFVSNCTERDVTALLTIFETLENDDEIHSYVQTMKDIIIQGDIKFPNEIFHSIYLKNNCAICRASLVRESVLSENISSKLLLELEYDCDPETRQLAKENNKKF